MQKYYHQNERSCYFISLALLLSEMGGGYGDRSGARGHALSLHLLRLAVKCADAVRAASCASVTSGSSLIGNGLRYCHSASACYRVHQKLQLRQHRLQPTIAT